MANNLDLGLIGNCSISALVDKEARIVWCCLPRIRRRSRLSSAPRKCEPRSRRWRVCNRACGPQRLRADIPSQHSYPENHSSRRKRVHRGHRLHPSLLHPEPAIPATDPYPARQGHRGKATHPHQDEASFQIWRGGSFGDLRFKPYPLLRAGHDPASDNRRPCRLHSQRNRLQPERSNQLCHRAGRNANQQPSRHRPRIPRTDASLLG